MIGLSRKAAEANPALARWLAGAGLPCAVFDGAARPGMAPCILDASESFQALGHDVLIEFAGEPALDLSSDGPTVVRFGFEDMTFAYALIAELLRPTGHPACGEPESAGRLELVRRIAASEASVLVLGETGTGKEGIARFIHSVSPRSSGPFIAVNCAALPESMLEAILFGHRKGSFTGAASESEGLFRAANGGTLLLDEVAEIPLALQAKLLRALQEREVLPVGAVRAEAIDVRVVACANKDLAAEVAFGRFRADLYWRLNVVPVELPPLRERRLDIRAIAAALLLRHHKAGAAFPFPTAASLERLMIHGWPGNCRELDNVLQRALLLRSGERIDVADIMIERLPFAEPVRLRSLGGVARAAEAGAIRAALAEVDGHRLRAAERLGISERTLRYRLAEMRSAAA